MPASISFRLSAGARAFFAAVLLAGTTFAQSGEWTGPAADAERHEAKGAAPAAALSQAIAAASAPYVSLAGDQDGFGFGAGWNPPNSCETFDNREPEDLGVFDQRQPGSTYDSICTFSGGWAHTFTPPPGGAARLTVALRILGGQGSTAFCWASPCGCVTPAQKIFINGVEYPFFYDPGCGTTTMWAHTWEGPDAAALAAAGSMNVFVDWGQNAFAIDFSRVTMLPAVEVAVHDGNGQRGVIGNPVEFPLAVKITSPDPSFNVAGMNVTFEIVSTPSNASGHGVGATYTTADVTYSATADADGVARAVLLLGNKAGDYGVRVKSPLSLTGATADFIATALKPDSVVILKDSPDVADKAPSYAVSATAPTSFHVVGLDAAGVKIGPIRSGWSLSAGGNPATRGDGSVSPATDAISTTLQPTKVGHLKIAANPIIAGVATGKADLFLTGLFVDVDGDFDVNAPADDTPIFVPGSLPSGASVSRSVMEGLGQPITLHLLTGPGSKGTVTFTIPPGSVSKWPGIAMNYPPGSTDVSADLALAGAATTITVPFAPNGDTAVVLYVRDYGAHGLIQTAVTSGKKTYHLDARRLPADGDGNKLPDPGWSTPSGTKVASAGLSPEEDFDADPVSFPPPSEGLVGDGLTAFEEFRGFVAAGQHRRLNPSRKDLFVVADPEVLIVPVNVVAILTKLPMSLHYLDFGEALMAQSADDAADDVKPVVNSNRSGIEQATAQRAIRIRERVDAPIYHRTNIGDDFPAELFVAGYTWVDPEDLHVIYDPSVHPLATPNGTQVVEYYPRAFENFAISYGSNGTFESILDKNGNPVIACADPANDTGCVVLDTTHQIAYKPPKELVLLAQAAGDDTYTKIALEACSPTATRRVMTPSEFAAAHTAVAGHEAAHALRVPHTTVCWDLMYTELFPSTSPTGLPVRITVIDVLPITLDYSIASEQKMRLHANQ